MSVRISRHPRMLAAFSPAALFVLLTGCAGHDHGHASSERQASVRERGQQVMPFRLDRTTHVFKKTTTGGIESVVAKTAADRSQVPLIRGHLRKEQQLFSRGDFSDPMAVHGMAMPGINVLRRKADQIEFVYRELPAGAELTYRTADDQALSALHEWFDAQLLDHGSDATP